MVLSESEPSALNLSRTRLRELASWIRDDLDPIIAREGPDVMLPDDVLTLNELFHTLLTSPNLSVNTLRATGIHRAVMYVCGKATRWPGRLADQCDHIVEDWKDRFGPLDALNPFLFGRGGRLEGIAKPGEHSKAALLKRWRTMCPDRLAPKVSRRHGHIGFKPGDWWISPLFAYHAGIIDLDTVEGGVCFDKRCAYAVLLKDPQDEIMGPSPSEFTYRCSSSVGRFRLTAANARSRYPVRVLRSHNLINLWAPKVGVRYEGLYRVRGWTLLPSRLNEVGELSNKENQGAKSGSRAMFEIHFEREDSVSIDEVMRHPLAAEIDDYLEYKRIRRAFREGKTDVLVPRAVAPAIQHTHKDLLSVSPFAPSRPPLNKAVSENFMTAETGLLLPKSSPSANPSTSDHPTRHPKKRVDSGSTLRPSPESQYSPSYFPQPDSSDQNANAHTFPGGRGSSEQQHRLSVAREVTPWLEIEPIPTPESGSVLESASQAESVESRPKHVPISIVIPPPTPTPGKAASIRSNISTTTKSHHLHPILKHPTKMFQGTNTLPVITDTGEHKQYRRSIQQVARSISPFAYKLRAGDKQPLSGNQDGQTSPRVQSSVRPISGSPTRSRNVDFTPTAKQRHSDSTDKTTTAASIPVLGPTPLRPFACSPLLVQRRDAFSLPPGIPIISHAATDVEWASFMNATSSTRPLLPVTDPFIEAARGNESLLSATEEALVVSPFQPSHPGIVEFVDTDDQAESWVYGGGSIVFKNPFRKNGGSGTGSREDRYADSDVAPDEV